MRNLFILIAFSIIGWFLFTFRILDVPPGINGDEAVIGYSSTLIARTAHDSNGRFLPVFTTISWPDWKQPVTIYSTVLFFKAFGISYFNLRVVSVLFVLASGVITFFLIKEVFNTKMAILSLFIFVTIPIIMIQSHLAIENIAPLPFIAFWLWMLAKYTKNQRNKYLILAALALSLSIFSYLGLRLIMPILTLLSIAYIFYLGYHHKRKNAISSVLVFFATILPFLIILFLIRNQYPGAIFALNQPRNVLSYQEFFLPYLSSFDLSFLFMKGDITPYHSTGQQGMFLLATLPVFMLGLFRIAKAGKPFYILVLLAFFLTPALYGLPGSIYRSSRLLTLIPAFTVITLLGFQSLFEIRKKLIKVGMLLLVAIIIAVNYVDFVFDYWFDYPNRVNQHFEKPIHRFFDDIYFRSKNENLTIYLQEDIPKRNPPAYLFFETSYFPEGLKRWNDGERLPENSVVVVSSFVYNKMIKPENIEVVDNGPMDLILLISRPK